MEPRQMETEDMAALGKPGKEQCFLPKACSPQAPIITPPTSPAQKASQITGPWPQRFPFPSNPLIPPLTAQYLLETALSLGPYPVCDSSTSTTGKGAASQCAHCRCGIKLSSPLGKTSPGISREQEGFEPRSSLFLSQYQTDLVCPEGAEWK